MTFKNKSELINFIEHQTNVKLINDKNDCLNSKRNLLHTEIDLKQKYNVLSLLNKYGIKYEYHVNNSYFIYVK